jgi:L-proline---[L-prolyl-carrier protein] ligase
VTLEELVVRSARRHPDKLAVRAPEESLSYAELDSAANRLARGLHAAGVRRGDRIALWLDKSGLAVTAMQAALRLGAVYVPVDPGSPGERARRIISDCAPVVVLTSPARAEELDSVPAVVVTAAESILATDDSPLPEPGTGEDDLAYILYTSGSTGTPKGVCLSHRNALAFVEWAAQELAAGPDDRFANHAPFHFDLSVLDLYVAFASGASVHLIGQELSFAPRRLVEFLLEERITVWYSVPSVLVLMMRDGGLLDHRPDFLRALLFAGEPFPVKHLRALREQWPDIRFLNLYGPTETNVCTYHEVDTVPAERDRPVPIGRACSGDTVRAVDVEGRTVAVGAEGELVVEGPTVMLGYWGRDPHTGPYHTGDLVVRLDDGAYEYRGRADQLVKVNGVRVELGDIDAALLSHPNVSEVTTVLDGHGVEARLVAFVVPAGERGPSLLSLKRHCAKQLPPAMVVHAARTIDELPRNPNGKIDRAELRQRIARAAPRQ